MASRVTFSGEHLVLSEIAEHHLDLNSALAVFFSTASPEFQTRFVGYVKSEITTELASRLEEIGRSSSLAVLASLEAAFRIDYLQRCYRRDRQPISREFRAIYREKEQYASFENDILEGWLQHYGAKRSLISELRGALKFRHWLAHGRYWTPKLGRRYDYDDLYVLADEIFETFPFFGHE